MSIDERRQGFFFEHFTDHAGQTAYRYGAQSPDDEESDDEDAPWPPDNYEQHRVFCFQVYVTFHLVLDEEICEQIAAHLIDLDDSQTVPPIWEFYIAERTVLDCVDHSRREISHRRTLDGAAPRIYPLQRREYDGRRMAFAFILDVENGWKIPLKGTQFVPIRFPDKSGPLWAHFDPHFPSNVVDIDEAWLYDSDHDEERLDQLEMEVMRVQGKDIDSQLFGMYYRSAGAIANDEAAHDDEVNPPRTTSDANNVDSSSLMISGDNKGLTIASTKGDPGLQYIVCMTFDGDLEQIARTFAATIAGLTSKTFRFTFYTARSDTEALATMPDVAVGVLTDAFAKRAHWDELGTYRSAPGQRRLHPLEHKPRMYFQDPATSQNRFEACLILIDRSDFLVVPAVRFLLNRGWPQHYEQNNYLEMLSWRASSMQAVVDRLMLEYKAPKDMT